ncbi:hypothetical protein CPB86DRAFT_823094 [Serendipita vermifera]|nr:hypothetical protein CPB86DRAFT_823094 [Serendipita vermifera]
MVEAAFKDKAKYLLAVWDRTKFGLSPAQYNAKTPTIKDLQRIWRSKFPPLAAHSFKSTVLLDDSVRKAKRQPDNHVCVTDYTAAVRANDAKYFCAVRGTAAQGSTGPDAAPSDISNESQEVDSILLAIVGILDELRAKDDVSSWLRAGGIRRIPMSDASILPETDKSEPQSTEAGSIKTLPTVNSNSTGLWFEDDRVLRYWIQKGKEVLNELEIPIIADSNS